MWNYKNVYLPQWPTGAKELKLIFIFGIEPYAQILTLAVCAESKFIFKSICTDSPGAGNYPCAPSTPGFGSLIVLKRLLPGCIDQGLPLSSCFWGWSKEAGADVVLLGCRTIWARKKRMGMLSWCRGVTTFHLSHPNISIPDMKDVLRHSQSFAGQNHLSMSCQHRLWQPSWPERFMSCSLRCCERTCPGAMCLVMPWKHLHLSCLLSFKMHMVGKGKRWKEVG